MRLTYTNLYNQFLRNINQSGVTTDTSLNSTFNFYLGTRYQLMLAKLKNFKTELSTTFTTVTDANSSTPASQYYNYPLGEISIDGIFITIGSVNYPLQVIDSIFNWENLNAIQLQASAVPQFFFPRRDDFGIWPIPQSTYTGTISYHYRDRNLSVADYSTGTVTVTNGSATVTGSGTTFTPAMVGRWFCVTDTTVAGQGLWFRISAYTSATSITLYQKWTSATASGVAYNIGETPELPEEGHVLLLDGVLADYYTFIRKDMTNAQHHENIFWTGDPGNDSRQEGNTNIAGGLIGLVNRYADRDDTRIIKRNPKLNPISYKPWGSSIS